MDLERALEKYKDAMVADYRVFAEQIARDGEDPAARVEAMVRNFEAGITFKQGKKYIKVLKGDRPDDQTSVHSFIVNVPDKKFKEGDILKSAGWAQPAKNRARGNIFGEYRIRWTGAEYLR